MHFILLFILMFFGCIHADASVSPIAITVLPALQFPAKEDTIAGSRLSLLWGEHTNVYGLDLGIIGNLTEKNLVGTSLAGVFNRAGTSTILGAQLALGANLTKEDSTIVGVQMAGLFNGTSGYGHVFGLQAAVVGNFVAQMNIYGMQLGGFNRADKVYGIQIGVINHAESLHGVQVGLINFHSHGFLPIFPFINVGL